MKNLSEKGISDYYNSLPFGEKDRFIRDAADAIGKSSQAIRRKIRLESFGKLELEVINQLISDRK